MQVVVPATANAMTYKEKMRQEQYKIKYQQDLKSYTDKIEVYNNNKERVAGILWNRCNRAMQSKIENRKDYETTIKGNPIELLKAIKQHALSFQDTKWSILTVIDAMKAFLNMKQKEGEVLIDYLKRFKTARDVFILHIGGPMILTKVVEQHQDYATMDYSLDAAALEQQAATNYACVKDVFKQFLAGLYVENCDKLKYGEFSSYLTSQFDCSSHCISHSQNRSGILG